MTRRAPATAGTDGSPVGEADHGRTLLSAIVESADDAITSIALDSGVLTSWNRGAGRLYGYVADEVLGRPFSVLVHPDHPLEIGVVLRDVAAGKRVEPFESLHVRKDGGAVSVALTVSPVQDARGRVVGASAVMRDITERMRAEERAGTASRYARSLIEASLDPLVTISPDGKITDVNEATTKVTGVPRERLIGTDFSEYFVEPEKAREGYQRVFAQGFVTDYPLTIRHRDGRLTDVLYNASVYRDVRGSVLGVFAAARDVTAQKKAEAEVTAQRTREMERLAELERFQRLTVGRELKMIELKKEIEELRRSVGSGGGTA